MPRYIDADALTENINNLSVMLCGKELFGEMAKHSVTQMIDEHPSADVVPVEEVERIMKEHIDFRKEEGDVRAEIALEQALTEIVEQRKKYTVKSE